MAAQRIECYGQAAYLQRFSSAVAGKVDAGYCLIGYSMLRAPGQGEVQLQSFFFLFTLTFPILTGVTLSYVCKHSLGIWFVLHLFSSSGALSQHFKRSYCTNHPQTNFIATFIDLMHHKTTALYFVVCSQHGRTLCAFSSHFPLLLSRNRLQYFILIFISV